MITTSLRIISSRITISLRCKTLMVRTSNNTMEIPSSPHLMTSNNTRAKIHIREDNNNTTQATSSRITEVTTQISLFTRRLMMGIWIWLFMILWLSKKSLWVSFTHIQSKATTQREKLIAREDSSFSMISATYFALDSQVFTFLQFQRKLHKARKKKSSSLNDAISLTCSSKNALLWDISHSQRSCKLSWGQKEMQNRQ